ncbi:DUF6388 family protein [Pseudomonas sp. DSP3-2-2]|uniref:DUF6388 family protein n=1 Tax=unclassified Pseudomonas TaxID=196821 RepID=UPI003CF50897
MTQTEHPHQIALTRFLAAHPQLQDELNHLNPLAAQAAGVTKEQYREERLHEAFEEEAQRLGFFAWELTLQLTAESSEEFESQRREVHKEVAEMAGMEWSQYCEMHGIEP